MIVQLLRWWERRRAIADCPYCKAPEGSDCRPQCPMLQCGECAGLGVVMDLDNKLGFDEESNPVYAGMPCPRCYPS